MENKVFLIGSGATADSIKTVLKDSGTEVVIVESMDGLAIPTRPNGPFGLEAAPIITEPDYCEYKSGRELRRERRKKERKTRK